MKQHRFAHARLAFAIAGALACAPLAPALIGDAMAAPATPAVKISSNDIGGVVNGPKGPEAGVWVIAETADLPTAYTKMVVTDDQGRFVIPELPKANYQVWARGYGLVDSAKTQARPGKLVAITARAAPTEAAAAEYYPGVYWYSMLQIPAAGDFPGTGEKGNGIPEVMKTQAYWIDSIKNSCQSCHALGSQWIRHGTHGLGHFNSSLEAWARRTQSGQAMINMALTLGRLGPEKGLKLFADWTDRINAGELPFAKPERPQGLERNVVITSWNWSTPYYYLHDAVSSDKRNPTVNANGKIYGSPEESTDNIPWLDPVRNTTGFITHPVNQDAPSSRQLPMQPSAHWGEDPIWDGHSSIHNPMLDGKGRLWITARFRADDNPAFCKEGSSLPSAQVAPQKASARQLAMYDPKTQKWTNINTCFSTHHLYFAQDANNTLWTSAGPPQSGVVGWLNTKMFDATGDEQKSQGWTPLIVDTNGNGKRDEYTEANQPFDPSKDRRVMAAFYGVQPAPDGSIWGQAMDVGFTRIDQPGYLLRLTPGPDPTHTSLTELYLPPDGIYGSRGVDVTSDGVMWTVFSSGHMGSFDRRKCKGPLNGPAALTGKHCPEGWAIYKFPGPQFKGVDDKGAADHAYYIWVDRENTLGLGKNVPIAELNGGESLLAVVDGKFVNLHVPYPMGFFTKNVDGRIDNPKAGWKGRAVWTSSGTRTVFHNEGGTQNQPKVYKFQVRPDPLAH